MAATVAGSTVPESSGRGFREEKRVTINCTQPATLLTPSGHQLLPGKLGLNHGNTLDAVPQLDGGACYDLRLQRTTRSAFAVGVSTDTDHCPDLQRPCLRVMLPARKPNKFYTQPIDCPFSLVLFHLDFSRFDGKVFHQPTFSIFMVKPQTIGHKTLAF